MYFGCFGKHLTIVPNVFTDGGSENCNEHVDRLITNGLINRTIAQIDVEFSNSMVEMVFHRLKHRFLFNIPLTNFAALVKGVDFYFTQSNEIIPRAILNGATPLEAFTGQWTNVEIESIK
ncbi:MAG: hypothetical protein ACOH5I_22475 [Oligoflexus sp.]